MEATLQSPSGLTLLETSLVTIGQSPNNQLIVNDPNASPHHAVLRSTEQGYTITDLGSVNGTFVNGQRLAPNVHLLLHTGDQICIGETMFTYEVHNGKAMVVGKQINREHTPVELPPASEYTNYNAAAAGVNASCGTCSYYILAGIRPCAPAACPPWRSRSYPCI
jgi:predicted component of type VI protein secretion system